MNYRLSKEGVILIPDEGKRKFIPSDIHNGDWRAFQKWLALGNTPLPDESSVAEAQYQAAQKALREEIETSLPTWSEVSGAIDTAWPAGAQRTIIKRLARAVYVIFKRKSE